MSDSVEFLHADKQESLLKIETKIFWWVWSCIPKVLKIAGLQYIYNISKKMLQMKLTFMMEINMKFDLNILGVNVFHKVVGMTMKTRRAWLWEWSSILKVLKVRSLQRPYIISKKKF